MRTYDANIRTAATRFVVRSDSQRSREVNMPPELPLTPYQARLRERMAEQVKEEIFELVAVNRLDVKEQTSLRRFSDFEEAKSEAEAHRKTFPLRYCVVFLWTTLRTRLTVHHTL
jgi:hypothetical protein